MDADDERTTGSAAPAAARKGMTALSRGERHALVKTMMKLQANVRQRSGPYGCFLDEPPFALAPRLGLARTRTVSHDAHLVVNPTLHLQEADDPPGDVVRRTLPLGAFARGDAMAWVMDPGTQVWLPFAARGAWVDALRSLEPGGAVPRGLPAEVRHTLAAADILVTEDHTHSRTQRWNAICETAGLQFRTEGYAIVRDLIHPLHLGAMRRYYRALVAGGGLPLGDFQVARRYQLGNEILSSFFHPQLTPLVSRIAGEPVKASYAYLASYLPGADLKPHLDREQCEFSISLLVDYDPDPDGACGWPIFMENPAAPRVVRTVDLGIGDAVFYRGRELVHYRNPLPDAHASTSYFLHYVRESFAGRLW